MCFQVTLRNLFRVVVKGTMLKRHDLLQLPLCPWGLQLNPWLLALLWQEFAENSLKCFTISCWRQNLAHSRAEYRDSPDKNYLRAHVIQSAHFPAELQNHG